MAKRALYSIVTGFVLLVMASEYAIARELEANDFKFDGEFGSEGTTIEKMGKNDFKITAGASPCVGEDAPPEKERRNLIQFIIPKNAKGNDLTITKYFKGKVIEKDEGCLDENWWSYDKKDWKRIVWRKGVIKFPVFEQDTVYLWGVSLYSVPYNHENIVENLKEWGKSPYVKTHVLGQSFKKKLDIYRFEITDPNSSVPRN